MPFLVAGCAAEFDGGIDGATALIRFVDATLSDDPSNLFAARDAVRTEVGDHQLVDAAAIIGTFQMMNRIANATGTPLDAMVNTQSQDIHLSRFESSPAEA